MKNMELGTKRIGLNSFENIDCNIYRILSLLRFIFTRGFRRFSQMKCTLSTFLFGPQRRKECNDLSALYLLHLSDLET